MCPIFLKTKKKTKKERKKEEDDVRKTVRVFCLGFLQMYI